MDDEEEVFDLSAAIDEADQGLSLDRLSATYAEALGKPAAPFAEKKEPPQSQDPEETTSEAISRLATEDQPEDACELSPLTILESMLFVGTTGGDQISVEKAASVMRGVTPDEIYDLVAQLNERYETEGCPYQIESIGGNLRMTLHQTFKPLREKFYGKVREAKLSQPAIDVLSLVAYHQGTTRELVDEMRGKPSGPILNQLVRRRLIRVQPDPENKRTKRYFTTQRFLQLFGLASLDDLPQPQTLED